MQTFLPVPDFRQIALLLDRKRLGKQRTEAMQILNAIRRRNGWSNHPAVRMWTGFEDALGLYMNTMIAVWIERGGFNTMNLAEVPEVPEMPPWLGEPELHASHRARLLCKMPAHYAWFGWSEQPCAEGYVWPFLDERGKWMWTDLRNGHKRRRTLTTAELRRSPCPVMPGSGTGLDP